MLVWNYSNSSYDFWNLESVNRNTKCTGKPQSSISMHPFSNVSSQNYLNRQIRINKLVNNVFLPPFSFKMSLKDTSFHISLNSLGFCLSIMLAELSLTCIFQHVWENFSIYGVHIPRKCVESIHFYSCPSLPLKTPGRIFCKSFSPEDRRGGCSYDLLYQNSIRKYEDDLEH